MQWCTNHAHDAHDEHHHRLGQGTTAMMMCNSSPTTPMMSTTTATTMGDGTPTIPMTNTTTTCANTPPPWQHVTTCQPHPQWAPMHQQHHYCPCGDDGRWNDKGKPPLFKFFFSSTLPLWPSCQTVAMGMAAVEAPLHHNGKSGTGTWPPTTVAGHDHDHQPQPEQWGMTMTTTTTMAGEVPVHHNHHHLRVGQHGMTTTMTNYHSSRGTTTTTTAMGHRVMTTTTTWLTQSAMNPFPALDVGRVY